MKKKFMLVLSAFLLFFAVAFTAKVELKAADAEIAGKIVFHYQLWDQDYSSAGLWVWNAGSGGSSSAVTSDIVDEFGAVYEVNVAADANADQGIGIIALRKDITLDSRWDYRETPDGENFFVDPTPILDGTVEEMHIYYFQGGYQTYYVADPSNVNVLVAYYDPTGGYEANLGLHGWGSWLQPEVAKAAWASPAKVFADGFASPAGVKGKIAQLSRPAGDASGDGFLVYAGDDASKKTPEQDTSKYITDLGELQAGDVAVIYVTGGTAYYGENALQSFVDSAFKFDFIDFNAAEVSGTYAVNKTTIFTKFSIALATKEVIGTETVTKTKIEQKPQVVGGGDPFSQTDKTFAAAELGDLPAGAKGRVVLHYQNWNGDYTGTGAWVWSTGASDGAIAHCGVDSFGAVIDLPISSDNNEIGLIAMNANTTPGSSWCWSDSDKASGDIKVDVSAIQNGTVEEIHVYAFQANASNSNYFIADPAKVNVLVVYYDQAGNYEENLGFHSWGIDQVASAWGTPLTLFKDAFVSPRGVTGKVAHLTADPGTSGGFLVYAGDDATKKTPENASNSITDLSSAAAGSVLVEYVDGTLKTPYYGATAKADFAQGAFSGEIEWVDVEVEYEEEVDVYGYIDFASHFTVLQGETEVEIKTVYFNQTAESANEFVIELAQELDNTKEYVIKYSNGLEGDQLLEAECNLALDTQAPVITLLDEGVIEIAQGSKWDQTLFPLYRVTDDRDATLQNKVYVKPGHGTLNTNVAGDYEITLVVEDTWGNVAETTFVFRVVPAETGCAVAAQAIIALSMAGLALIFFKRRYM